MGLCLKVVAGSKLAVTNMILNSDKVQAKIIDFIKSYAKTYGKTLLVLSMDNANPAQMALAEICLKTNIHTLAVVPDNFDLAIKKLNIVVHHRANIENHSFDLRVNSKIVPNLKMSTTPWDELVKYGVMNQIASTYNGIIVGSITRELLFGRVYQKGCLGDILPLGDLFLQEIKQLYPNIGNHSGTDEFTIEELEWACRENDVSRIIENSGDPIKHREWGRFTLRQRHMIARLNQIEKLTRHKVTHAPICELRNTQGLVR